MTDKTAKFFTGLEHRQQEPLLEYAHGTMRFDLRDKDRTEHWLLTLDKGHGKVDAFGRGRVNVGGA